MRNFSPLRIATAAALCALAASAFAQEPSLESRLREALRKTTADLHAMQDQVAAMTAERDELKTRLEVAPAPAAPPPAPAVNDAELAGLRVALATANARNAALQSQLAAEQTTLTVRTNEARAQATTAAAAMAGAQGVVKACHETNEKLAKVATDILNTYKSESFRAVWLRSYEPVLGLDRVRLENIMQDFEDRLREQRLPATR
jgi:hypothetical protein